MTTTPLPAILRENDDSVVRIRRFQSLEPGSYWQLVGESTSWCDTGVVLLLLDIELFEGTPHTVVLRSHPRDGRERTFKILVDEFLEGWEFTPDGEAIRARELAELQSEIVHAQQELVQVQTSQELLVPVLTERLQKWERDYEERERRTDTDQAAVGIFRAELPGSSAEDVSSERIVALRSDRGQILTSLSAAIDVRLTDSDVRALSKVVEREAVIAETKAKFLEDKVAIVSSKVSQMTPFFAEKSAVALARTKGVQNFARELMKGLSTLNLYTGVGVAVETLCTGAEAKEGEPLTLMQRKLFMNEEIAAHVDVEENFDYESIHVFDEYIANDATLRDRIFPTQRCVVSMAVRQAAIDYGRASDNMLKNGVNKQVFLLVRNGENIHRVHSAEASHESTPRLFPSRDEVDRPFRGIDGTRVKFNDLRFTQAARQSQDIGLHYKRLLVLLCGLDHRLGLFGRFHEEGDSLSFISMAFQERYMRFVADDETDHLLGEGRLPVREWIASRNKFMQSGSRVLCLYDMAMTPNSAPSCQKIVRGSRADRVEVMADPLSPSEILIVYRDGKDLCVDVKVTREKRSWRDLNQVEFNARLDLRTAMAEAPTSVICLDAVNCEDLLWYVNSRENRTHHVDFIRMFKRTAMLLTAQQQVEAPAVAWLCDSIRDAGFCAPEKVDELVDAAVRAWRCANRGAWLPSLENKKAFDGILSVAHSYTREDQFARMLQQHADSQGLTPLRGVLTGKNRLALYAQTPQAGRDERVVPWGWVTRQSLSAQKNKLVVSSEKLVWLERKPDAKEADIQQWKGLEDWVHTAAEPVRPAVMSRLCDQVESMWNQYAQIFCGPGKGLDDALFERLARQMRTLMWGGKSKFVKEILIHMPIGAFMATDSRTGQPKAMRILSLSAQAVHWLHHFGNEKQASHAEEMYISIYVKKDEAKARVRGGFAPSLSLRETIPEGRLTDGIWMADSDEASIPLGWEKSLQLATNGWRSESGDACFDNYFGGERRDIKRDLDAQLAFWMRDVQTSVQKKEYCRPERVLMPKALLDGLAAVPAGAVAHEGPIARFVAGVR